MINFLKRRNAYLLKNKPEKWFTQSHYYIWPLILLLLLFVAIGFALPISSNVTGLFFFTSPIALTFLFLLGRHQYLYATRLFTVKQLHKIFWVNFSGVLLVSLLTVSIPFVVAKRAQQVLDRYDFSMNSDQIRVAMIKAPYIQLLKSGVLEVAYLDSVFKSSEDEYGKLERQIWDLDGNKFVKNSLREYASTINPKLDYTKTASTTDTPVAVIPDTIMKTDVPVTDDTMSRVLDSPLHAHGDKTKTFNETTTNSSAETGTGNLRATLGSVTYKWDDLRNSFFLSELKAMPDKEIDSIKRNIQVILDRYDFDTYHEPTRSYEEEDSINRNINKYYDRLNKQSQNLFAADTFARSLLNIIVLVLMASICLSQLSIVVMMQIKSKEKVAAFLTLFGTLALFYIGNNIRDDGSNIANILWLLLNIVLAIMVWANRSKEHYKPVSAYLFLTFYFALPFWCITAVLMFLNEIGERFFSASSISLTGWIIIAGCLFWAILILANYQFIKRIYQLNNLPKQS